MLPEVGGGGGILIDTGGTLNLTGGYVSENNCNFSSGGGIAVNKGYAGISISGGEITNNFTTGNGGGIFARGDGDPLQIIGGKISGNTASNGGAVLFWTVGSSEAKNKLIIGGAVEITNNTATINGGGISVGRESQDTGIKCYLEIQENALISKNTAGNNGGGIYLQPDNGTTQVNTVLISGGTISNNTAVSGAGMFIPDGIVTMTGGTILNNQSTEYGGGIYVTSSSQSIDFTMTSGSIIGNTANINGGGVAINMDSESVYAKVIIGLETCMGLDETHSHPIIQDNTAYENGGGFWINGLNGENMTMIMYCGNIEKNVAILETGSSNIYQTGGLVTVEAGYVGEGVIVIGGEYVYVPNNQIPERTIIYNSNVSGAEETKQALVTVGVEIYLPQNLFTRENYVLVGWSEVREPGENDTIYEAGGPYLVTDEDITVYAIWKLVGEGEIQTPVIKAGKHYNEITGGTSVMIASNSFITTQMSVKGMIPSLYTNRTISFDKNLINGTKIIMIDLSKNDSREYYYYLINDDSTQSIALSEFLKMGENEKFLDSTTEESTDETFLFILELPNNNENVGTNQITLTRYSTEAERATIKQTSTYTTTIKRAFELNVTVGENLTSSQINVTYNNSEPSGVDSRNEGKKLSLIISGENLSEETKIYDGTNYYTINSEGNYLIPLGTISESKEKGLKLISKTLSENEIGCNLDVELWVSENVNYPGMGEKVAEVNDIVLEAVELFAIKLEIGENVFYSDEFFGSLEVKYKTAELENYTTTLEVQKKISDGSYETQTGILTTVDGNSENTDGVFSLDLNSSGTVSLKFVDDFKKQIGTYRILLKASDESGNEFEVPCNFMIVE